MVERQLCMQRGGEGGEAALTCFGQVPQGGAERAPLQPLSAGVAVIQTRPGQAPVPRVLLQAGALRHAGTNHPLLLLQLGCNTHGAFFSWGLWGQNNPEHPCVCRGLRALSSFTPPETAGCASGLFLEKKWASCGKMG